MDGQKISNAFMSCLDLLRFANAVCWVEAESQDDRLV